MAARTVWVVAVDVYDPAVPGEVTKYYATKGFATIGTDTPADQHVDERVKQPLQINRTMFAPNTTRGRSTVGVGDITLVNGDGELDDFTTYGVDGRTVVVRKGTEGAAYPAGYPVYWTGTMQGVEVTQDHVFLKIRDRLAELNVPLQTTKYTGGGLGTLEGTEDTLKGKPKPICYGVVKNIAPPCVETAKLIFQVADATVNSIDAVYDRGVSLRASLGPLFVAVGSPNTPEIHTSPDGTTWTERSQGFDAAADIIDVIYGNDTWVAVSNDTTGTSIATSSDGITWAMVDNPFGSGAGSDIRAIAFGVVSGVEKFMICGSNGRVASSADGETWAVHPGAVFNTGPAVTNLFYDNALWLASAASGVVGHSFDGVVWAQQTISASLTIFAFGYGSGVWLVVGALSGVPAIYTSTTGVSWTSRTVPASHTDTRYAGVTFGNSLYVVVGFATSGQGLIATSSDGTTWTAQAAASTNEEFYDVVYGNGTYVIVGGASALNGVIESSTNGTAWTSRTLADNKELAAVAHGEGGTATVYASSTDLLDNALAPAAGRFKPYLSASGSYFRLGASPSGLVTADVTQGAAASDRTTAQIWEAILDERGGMAAGDWNATDVSDLDTANNDVIGYWTDQEARVADVIDMVKDSAGAASFVDISGDFRIKQFLAPSGSAVLSLTANDLLRALRRILPSEQGQGIPQYRTILRYQKNYTPQSTDVAASVSDSRRAFLAKEWREIADTDATVQTKHLLAIESVEETLLDVAADVTTEADRRQALRGADRQMFELWLPLNDDTDSLELNDVIEITHDRYGLSGGELARIIGLNINAEKAGLTVTAWM